MLCFMALLISSSNTELLNSFFKISVCPHKKAKWNTLLCQLFCCLLLATLCISWISFRFDFFNKFSKKWFRKFRKRRRAAARRITTCPPRFRKLLTPLLISMISMFVIWIILLIQKNFWSSMNVLQYLLTSRHLFRSWLSKIWKICWPRWGNLKSTFFMLNMFVGIC